MRIRNLDSRFDTGSVAAIGASLQAGHVGTTVWRNQAQGRSMPGEAEAKLVLADEDGVMALDAPIRLSVAAPAAAANFAILPYPAQRTESLVWQGRALTLRAIRPEDEAQHLAFLERLSPQGNRMRLFYGKRSIGRSELARLTQIDYAREMAFVAVAADPDGPAGAEQTLGVVHAITDPDNEAAAFGLRVRPDLKGSGLGRRLLDKMLRCAHDNGTRRLQGMVAADNHPMLALARETGFALQAAPDGASFDIVPELF